MQGAAAGGVAGVGGEVGAVVPEVAGGGGWRQRWSGVERGVGGGQGKGRRQRCGGAIPIKQARARIRCGSS